MRWLAAFAVVMTALFFFAFKPRPSGELAPSDRFPAAAATKEPAIDLLAAIKEFRKTLASPKFNATACAQILNQTYKAAYDLRPQRFDLAKLRTQSKELLAALFETKILLRAQLKDKREDCIAAARNVLRAGRVLEDTIGEYALDFPEPDDENQPGVLQGEAPYMMVNPAFTKELKSGDVIVSRGTAFVSAAIARMTDEDSNLSHAEIFYEDPETGKRWTIGSHIEVGSIVQPYENYIRDGKVRALVYRHPDAKLASKAAEAIFKKVRAYRDENGENIPYDFGLNDADPKELYCAELVSHAFHLASGGKIKIPLNASKIRAKNRDFFDRIGIKSERAFVPADFEVDPRFELVAEWRDYTRVHASHLHDAILTSIFDWMERGDYVLKETSLIGIKKLVAWHLRRWPIFSSILRNKLPTNMSQDLIGAMTALNETSEALFARVEATDEAYHEAHGYWMTPAERFQDLEVYRREDLRAYQTYQKTHGYDPLARRPEFHLLFRPR